MGRRVVVLGLLLSFGLLSAPPNASASGAPMGVLHPRLLRSSAHPSAADTRAVARRRRRRKGNLLYHNGAVLPNSTVHAIFWDPFGQTFPTGYEDAINQYFTDVAHDSGGVQNVYSVAQQYKDNKGHHATYDVTVATPTDDSTTVTEACSPHSGGSPAFTRCVTDGQIQAEVRTDFPSRGAHDIYFVFLPPGLDTCHPQLGCLGNARFCAYHEGRSGSSSILYANMPFGDVDLKGGLFTCSTAATPNSGDADATINGASHEHIETTTDPFGGGWYSSRGLEIADKCQEQFDPLLGADYNQVINGHHYYLQEEWSNSAHGCRQRTG